MIHAARRVATKSKVCPYKTNSGQQEKQTRNAFSIYTHRRRLGPAGFTQFVILHEESHAMFKNSSPVTAKQGEALARAQEEGMVLQASFPEAHGGEKVRVFKIRTE